jgi:cytoskeletal protein CcmA (bactofilin family)
MFDKGKKDQPESNAAQPPEAVREPAPVRGTSSAGGDIAVIGHSIRIDGDLRGEEDLRVDGNISGTIQLPNHSLTIGKEGRINANAYAKSITVDGELSGDIYGSECVTIRANARVTGNVVATRVSVEEGAQFKGSIDMDSETVEAALSSVKGAGVSSDGRKKSGHAAADASNGDKQATEKPVGLQNLSAGNKT